MCKIHYVQIKVVRNKLVYSDVYQTVLKDNKRLFSIIAFLATLNDTTRDFPLKVLLKICTSLCITGISKYLLEGGAINVVKTRQDPYFTYKVPHQFFREQNNILKFLCVEFFHRSIVMHSG